jgi:hypothetical protein
LNGVSADEVRHEVRQLHDDQHDLHQRITELDSRMQMVSEENDQLCHLVRVLAVGDVMERVSALEKREKAMAPIVKKALTAALTATQQTKLRKHRSHMEDAEGAHVSSPSLRAHILEPELEEPEEWELACQNLEAKLSADVAELRRQLNNLEAIVEQRVMVTLWQVSRQLPDAVSRTQNLSAQCQEFYAKVKEQEVRLDAMHTRLGESQMYGSVDNLDSAPRPSSSTRIGESVFSDVQFPQCSSESIGEPMVVDMALLAAQAAAIDAQEEENLKRLEFRLNASRLVEAQAALDGDEALLQHPEEDIADLLQPPASMQHAPQLDEYSATNLAERQLDRHASFQGCLGEDVEQREQSIGENPPGAIKSLYALPGQFGDTPWQRLGGYPPGAVESSTVRLGMTPHFEPPSVDETMADGQALQMKPVELSAYSGSSIYVDGMDSFSGR